MPLNISERSSYGKAKQTSVSAEEKINYIAIAKDSAVVVIDSSILVFICMNQRRNQKKTKLIIL